MKIYGDENNAFILEELGKRIKEIRLSRSMSQKELAYYSGVAQSTLIRIENGEGGNLENLMKIMRILDLLQNFDLLVPEQELTPEEIFANVSKRKRAPKVKKAEEYEWSWGDEK